MAVDQTNLYAGFNIASRFNPVPRSTLLKALKPYQIQFDQLKGKTDSDLRRMAIQSVIAYRQKNMPNG